MINIISSIKNLLLLENGDIMLICIAVCAVIGALTGVIAVILKRKQLTAATERRNDNTENKTGEPPVEERVQDCPQEICSDELIMARNVIYSVGLEGQLVAGRYILKCADDSVNKFNLRYNGLVKEYFDNDVLTLADGDTLSPVSGSVIICRYKER